MEAYKSFKKDFGDNPHINDAVHDSCCKHCPSARGHDPETEDIKRLPVDLRRLTVFPCAWRHEKLCYGYIKLMEIK